MAQAAVAIAQDKVVDLVKKNRRTIASKLPKQLDADRFVALLFTEFRRTPKLLSCTQDSLMKTIFQCAAIGLYPDAVLGHAWLIPYGQEATLIVGYKGFIELAKRGGVTMEAHPIYENDNFEFSYGSESYIRHTFGLREARGELIGSWAQVAGGIFEVLSREDVEKLRDSSASYKNQRSQSPWTTHEGEMFRKSAIRRLSKMVPMCPELQKAVAFEGKQEAGEDPSVIFDDDTIDVTDESSQAATATRKATSELRERLTLKPPTAKDVYPDQYPDDCGCPDGPDDRHEPGCPRGK